MRREPAPPTDLFEPGVDVELRRPLRECAPFAEARNAAFTAAESRTGAGSMAAATVWLLSSDFSRARDMMSDEGSGAAIQCSRPSSAQGRHCPPRRKVLSVEEDGFTLLVIFVDGPGALRAQWMCFHLQLCHHAE